MRTLYLTALATGLAALSAAAVADTGVSSALPMMDKSMSGGMRGPMGGGAAMHRWGPRVQGRWYGGARAPGGWVAYRRPVYGWSLPRYWVSPNFYIANYGLYGLPAPRSGYGWSRYYDDAVLTDRDGRVYDSRSDIAWDRYEGGYADGPDGPDGDYAPPPRRDKGVGGAVIGGVVGGVAGNVIAGRGNRTVGTIVGAGVGALAGAAIDRAEDAPRHGPRGDRAPPPPGHGRYESGGYDMAQGDDDVTYDGTWRGTWHGDDGRSYSGAYSGTYNGSATPPPPRPGVGYDAPPMPRGPHWGPGMARGPMDGRDGPGPHGSGPTVSTYSQPGYYAGGYYYPGATVTTVVIQPAVTTTVEETSYVTRRVWAPRKARKRATCHCK